MRAKIAKILAERMVPLDGIVERLNRKRAQNREYYHQYLSPAALADLTPEAAKVLRPKATRID